MTVMQLVQSAALISLVLALISILGAAARRRRTMNGNRWRTDGLRAKRRGTLR